MVSSNSAEKQSSSVIDSILSIFKAIANWFMSFSTWFSSQKTAEKGTNAVVQEQKADDSILPSMGDSHENKVEEANEVTGENPESHLEEVNDDNNVDDRMRKSSGSPLYGRFFFTENQIEGLNKLKTLQAQQVISMSPHF